MVPSLRSTLGAATVIIMMLALVVAVALMLLTTYLHRTTHIAGDALTSVRLADQARIDLLLHERSRDRMVRHGIERDLQRTLNEARRFSVIADEKRILEQALARVNAYLEASRDRNPSTAAHAEAAYTDLHALVEINLDQAREALGRADRWNRLADWIGVGAMAILLLVGGGLIAWLRHYAFKPVFALFEVMRRFGNGDRAARAEETGHLELREMSRHFNEMASALAASRRAQLAFLGGIAHDLRNPLWALKLSAQTIDAGEPSLSPEQLRTLESISGQISRLERMVEDLLDAARIEAGELHIKMAPTDAGLMIRNVLQMLAGPLVGYRVRTAVPEIPVTVHCDTLRIEQVLTNLVSNAIKYSPAGALIEVGLEAGVEEVVFRVTDHGTGIPEEDQKRVFEPFQRAGLTTEIPGAGLGLFVVRRIVERHGGRITLDSAPGRGSTFRVYLPTGGPAETAPGRPRTPTREYVER